MVFDVDTTYFPNASRDNFGKPFGQNTYNFEWYIGDRTSIISYGWFEFFNIGGTAALQGHEQRTSMNPNGLDIITSGITITRPTAGEDLHRLLDRQHRADPDLGPAYAQYSYWMSPKWYGTVGASYDFGNAILLGATGSLTRIGARLPDHGRPDASARSSTAIMFAFEISPRLSPSIGLRLRLDEPARHPLCPERLAMYRPDEPASNAVEAPSLMTLAVARRTRRRPTAEPDGRLGLGRVCSPAADRIVRAGRRNLPEKLLAGLVGIKHAVRGDSSFFAHAYRALLIFLTAGMIGVSPAGLVPAGHGAGPGARRRADAQRRRHAGPGRRRPRGAAAHASPATSPRRACSSTVVISAADLDRRAHPQARRVLGWWERVGW